MPAGQADAVDGHFLKWGGSITDNVQALLNGNWIVRETCMGSSGARMFTALGEVICERCRAYFSIFGLGLVATICMCVHVPTQF